MAKYLVTKDTGPVTIEADDASLAGNGGMLIFSRGEGPLMVLVAGFVGGAWRAFERLDDTQTVH